MKFAGAAALFMAAMLASAPMAAAAAPSFLTGATQCQVGKGPVQVEVPVEQADSEIQSLRDQITRLEIERDAAQVEAQALRAQAYRSSPAPERDPNALVVGRWNTGEAYRGVQIIEFRSDGTLSNFTLGWTGQWRRDSGLYRFTFTEEPQYYYFGAISGDVYSGKVFNSDGTISEYTFNFSREAG
jgi:outer membrane murein-binding lipoprotein Lpp